MRLTIRAAIVAALLLPAIAAAENYPSSPRGEPGTNLAEVAPHFASTKEPVSAAGIKSVVDLPATQHMRNSGGNDRTKDNPRGLPGQGHGLCVFTAGEILSRWLNVMEMAGFQKWMESKPGGGFPAKVDQMIAQFCKEKGIAIPPYVQHTGGDDTFLDVAIATGRGCCVTYAGYDGFYKDKWGQDCWIDHMVVLAHLDATTAAIIDNNRPGSWVWMSRTEFLLRWRARGGGWAWTFLASPPPPHLLSQMLFAENRKCVCEDDCKCPPGECPGKCPVLIGQLLRRQPAQPSCPGGKCPVPETVPSLPNPFGPTYPPAGPAVVPDQMPAGPEPGRWQANTNGREWGYWVSGRCIAAAFADGRVEAVNEYGIATGVPIAPPAALPAGVRQLKPLMKADPEASDPKHIGENYGLMRDKIHQRPTYSITGVESTEEAVWEAMSGTLVNDADRWHLTAVGDTAFLARVKADIAALDQTIRSKLHTQSYTPTAWPINLFALPAGVSLRKPATARRSEQVGTLAAADYSPAKLVELLDLMNGPKPKPAPVTPADPDVKPKPDPPEPEADYTWLVVLAVVGIGVLALKGR